ncbi:MAG: hypothetical protein ACKV2U_26585 [Bryobacteraceae bacterium]
MIVSEEILKEAATYQSLFAKTKLDSATPEKPARWIEQVVDAPALRDALK